jgi:hypothetical protein
LCQDWSWQASSARPDTISIASAQDCWLRVVEDKTILVGQLVDRDGNVVQNEIDLDDYLDNVDGAIEWSG